MLFLFDIDATLISTSRSGMHALHDAGKDMFGQGFSIEGVAFAGRLDPLIIGDMLRLNGQEDSHENQRAIRERYATRLAERLAVKGVATALPGVHELIASLDAKARAEGAVTLGLLTGNFQHTGSMKLRACGIDPSVFEVAAWGDEAGTNPPKREDLVPVGMQRASKLKGRVFAGKDVTIIGDTPHDVRCAKVHGGRCLAVATGHFSEAELREAGADVTMANLSDVPAVMTWLFKR